MKNASKRKISLTHNLGIGKGRFKKAIREGLLLSTCDVDAYDIGLIYFDHRCAYCGMSGDVIQLTAEHIIPSSSGGPFIKGNIIPACQQCNSIRRERPLQEFISDAHVLNKIGAFQCLYGIDESKMNIDDALGENGKVMLEQLDAALNIMRDVARTAIRANERNETLPLTEWVNEFKAISKKLDLI